MIRDMYSRDIESTNYNDQTLEVAVGTLTSGISNKQVDVIIAESGAVYPIGLVNPAYLLRVEYTKI